jgi:hypothetical protein
VYKITNHINNKIYIGKHRTKDLNDKYMGSGKAIYTAIKKYGKENFTKQVLFVYDNEQEMNNKEKELVNENFVKSKQSYNIALGGKGGFSPTHDNVVYGKLGGDAYANRLKTDAEFAAKETEKRRKAGLKGCKKGGQGFKKRYDSDPELAEKTLERLKKGSAKGGQSYAYKMKTNPEFNQEMRELRRKKKPAVI